MPMTPDQGLHLLRTVRAARLARGLTQEGVAKEAHVSRAQITLFENGGNVSVKFLLKIARVVGLDISVSDGEGTSARSGRNALELIQSVDLLGSLVEHLRLLAVDTVLPPSERAKLTDAPAVRAFVARHAQNDDGLAPITEAVFQHAKDRSTAPPQLPEERQPMRHSRKRKA